VQFHKLRQSRRFCGSWFHCLWGHPMALIALRSEDEQRAGTSLDRLRSKMRQSNDWHRKSS
jgi:hypothetical protein